MKILGIVLVVIGGLMTLGAIANAFTTYDLSSSHDLSKFCGGIAVSLGIFVVGIYLCTKKENKE